MRTSDGYRFGLQFKALSDAHRQAGEFLESLGNKKSEAVVTALIEYLNAHPEAINKDNQAKIVAVYGYSEETLNAKIEAMVRKVAGGKPPDIPSGAHSDGYKQLAGEDAALDKLLDGLDRFL